MATNIQSSPFIKELASSDKRRRDEALQSLRMYLGAQMTMSELDLLKLWKGLFYCLWMQDKPLHQQRLSRDLASLITIMHEPAVFPFIRAFWITMAREWNNIEALRLDKYLFLIRQYLHASFSLLDSKEWSAQAVQEWNIIMEETPLNATNRKLPNGMRYHVLDIYVDELEKVGKEKWQNEENKSLVEQLIHPIEKIASNGRSKVLRTSAKECLADRRICLWMRQEPQDAKDTTSENDEEEWGGITD